MFEKFSVIDLIKTRSASVCTFAGNVVKFNIQTAQELRFPEYIQFLIEPKSKQFAIRACKEDAPNAVRFSKPEGEQKAQIKISNATVVDMVRKLMDWNAEDNWNVPGIYFAEEQGIMYRSGSSLRSFLHHRKCETAALTESPMKSGRLGWDASRSFAGSDFLHGAVSSGGYIPPHRLSTAFPVRPQYTLEVSPSPPQFYRTTVYSALWYYAKMDIPPFRRCPAV